MLVRGMDVGKGVMVLCKERWCGLWGWVKVRCKGDEEGCVMDKDRWVSSGKGDVIFG